MNRPDMQITLPDGTKFDLGAGTKKDLEDLGVKFDETVDNALAITPALLKIRNRLGHNARLAANPAQLQYAGKSWRKPRNIVLKARQMGVTTWIAGQFLLKTITHPGTLTVQVAHTQEAAEQIFRIVHRFFSQLPGALREGALKSARLSARRLLIPELDSEYLVETAGDRNAGRGLTITNVHCTELARWPGDATDTLCGLLATLSPKGSLVMESTPMGAAGCFWNQWRDAEKMGTVRHFFPWWLEPAYAGEAVPADSLSEEERGLMQQHSELKLEQIAFRRRIRESFRRMAGQEYAEDADSCFLASGECLFDTEAIDRRLREVAHPVETRQKGELRIWLRPQPGRQYLVAVDPAGGGTEGDYAAAQVIDLRTALQCAELRGHRNPLELAEESAALAREYRGALLAVERNNHGSGVLAYLRGVCRYHRLCQQGGQDGWPTTAITRPVMLARLGAALVETPALFQSERLLHECRSFVRHANGQSRAQAGEHDDCVMAMAIALAVREEELAGLQ